jgi:endogenous inhibitor of DNA gyrase (YacG/DUF329 family)
MSDSQFTCLSCGNIISGAPDDHAETCPLCPERQRLIDLLVEWAGDGAADETATELDLDDLLDELE